MPGKGLCLAQLKRGYDLPTISCSCAVQCPVSKRGQKVALDTPLKFLSNSQSHCDFFRTLEQAPEGCCAVSSKGL